MNSSSILWILGITAIIAFFIVLLIQSFKRKLNKAVSKASPDVSLFSDNEVGRGLQNLIVALDSGLPNTSSLLEELKHSAKDCETELTRAYAKLNESAYNTR